MSRVVLEMIEGGPYEDGWTDITCAFAHYQEQYRRVDGANEFRHRPVYKVYHTYKGLNVVQGHTSVRHGEPWLSGPSPDGSGRSW